MIDTVHPGHGADCVNPLVVDWIKVPYSLGPWPNWGLVGGHIQRWFSFGQVIVGTTLLQALLLPLYAVSPGPLWLGVVYGLMHFVGPIYNVVQFSHRIALIPPGLEGRVNAGYRFIAHLPVPLGAALCGVMIERVGSSVTLAFFASVFGVLTVAAAASRTIRHTPRLTGP